MNTNATVYDVYFDQSLNAVVMKWEGYATSSEFREGTELMLNTLVKHNCSKVLAAIRDMVLIGNDDQQWLTKVFLPRATQFGFKSIAIINPESYFNRVAIENVSSEIDHQNFSLSTFDTFEDASNWIRQSVAGHN